MLWPKRRILEVYLNIAEWGPGIFGAEAAARAHFGQSAGSLGARQAAQLAVSLPNPVRRDAGVAGAAGVAPRQRHPATRPQHAVGLELRRHGPLSPAAPRPLELQPECEYKAADARPGSPARAGAAPFQGPASGPPRMEF